MDRKPTAVKIVASGLYPEVPQSTDEAIRKIRGNHMTPFIINSGSSERSNDEIIRKDPRAVLNAGGSE